MTPADQEGLASLMSEVGRLTKSHVRESTAQAVEPLRQEIRGLQQRVAQLEALEASPDAMLDEHAARR
jgi:hypothetical protein